MEYKIVQSNDLQELVNGVTDAIAEGWLPLGNPVFATKMVRITSGAPWGGEFIQAMTRG
jgi:hypothetical protein